jgi:hypothetical protein
LARTRTLLSLATVIALVLPACSSLTVTNVDFGWPVESSLTVTSSNKVEDIRYALSFPVAPLAATEFGDSTALRGSTLRIIRNPEGYYFVTGPRFKHVYVFAPREASLVQQAVLAVSETGLKAPAFNLRPPLIELLDEGVSKFLSSSDIVEGRK